MAHLRLLFILGPVLGGSTVGRLDGGFLRTVPVGGSVGRSVGGSMGPVMRGGREAGTDGDLPGLEAQKNRGANQFFVLFGELTLQKTLRLGFRFSCSADVLVECSLVVIDQ